MSELGNFGDEWNYTEELLSGRITEEGRKRKTESNASEERKQRKQRTEQEDTTNTSARNSRLPKSSVVRQYSGAAQAQPTSQVHAAVSPLSTTPAVAPTSAATMTTSRPDAMIPQAGRWTRFWLSIGCVSAQYPDD